LPGPVDGVTTALDATELLEEDVRHARELGMTAKLLIHPRQVMPTQAGFRPDEESVRWARGVVAAVANGSAVGVDGHMVDAPVLARARLILGQAD
jgi:citrate lyase subunit beta/citryl-CoA lyase